MKYLLIFLVVLLIAWRWKTTRTALERKTEQKKAPAALEMVRCKQCGVHLPAHDAVMGTQGTYCSAAHRRLCEH
jgi:uncharacterized protein